MSSPAPRAEPPLRRHQLVRLYPAAWESLLRARADLAGEPLLHDWATQNWPLIARRRGPLDGDGVLLGLPLPPSAGKGRIAVEVRAGDVASVGPLPSVSEVLGTAPVAWRPCLQELMDLSRAYGVRDGVFGSLCWQLITGLTYLGPHSDIDIAWTLPRADQLERFLRDLADIDAACSGAARWRISARGWRRCQLARTARRRPRACPQDREPRAALCTGGFQWSGAMSAAASRLAARDDSRDARRFELEAPPQDRTVGGACCRNGGAQPVAGSIHIPETGIGERRRQRQPHGYGCGDVPAQRRGDPTVLP